MKMIWIIPSGDPDYCPPSIVALSYLRIVIMPPSMADVQSLNAIID